MIFKGSQRLFRGIPALSSLAQPTKTDICILSHRGGNVLYHNIISLFSPYLFAGVKKIPLDKQKTIFLSIEMFVTGLGLVWESKTMKFLV